MSRCFIIGKGASLRGFNFKRLKHEHTICINHAVFFVPNPNEIVFCDKGFYEKYKEEIDNFEGKVIAPKGTGYPDYSDNSKGYGILSGLYALQHTVGRFDEIYLLGFDLNTTDKFPYFDDMPNFTEQLFKKDHLGFYYDNQFNRKRLELFPDFKEYPIYNCNPDSAIGCFKFKDIGDVL